ncbi:MAG: hypothetical protein FWC34_10665 [Bacteroidetes bacterium]|nr:hypothetical protein [Bacteroidota bacterium]
MKKILLNFTALLFITGTIYSQDFYFGISSGLMKGVYSKTEQNDYIKDRINALSCPSINFTFSAIFKNNIEIETGIMYYPYPHNVAFRWDTIGATGSFTKGYFSLNGIAYHAFSLPIHIGYKVKLANRLYANVYSGLNFDFYFGNSTVGMGGGSMGDIYVSVSTENALKQQFNILLSNKVSLQYFTKFNMGISLYAAYYSGLFSIWESYAYANYHDVKIFHNTLLSRGSYWNFGIELGYKLEKNREKKTKKSEMK